MSAEFRYEPLLSGRNPVGINSRQPVTEIGGRPFLAGIHPPEGADGMAWPSDEAEIVDSGPNAGVPEVATHARCADLVHGIRSGHERSEAELYAVLDSGIRFYLARRLKPADIRDRVHDIFVIIVGAIRSNRVRDPARLMGFIHTVAARQAVACMREESQSRWEDSAGESMRSVCDPHHDPEERYALEQRVQLLRKALGQLNQLDRDILERFYLREQSKEQICGELRLTPTQFRLRKSRALDRLGQMLENREFGRGTAKFIN
jgi:RNA polymerase sigma factor (sigma-70 family)